MKEAQRQRARAVGDAAQQLSAAAERHLGELHLALDDGALANAQRADRRDAGAILVAQRQQEQQILDRADAELRELRRRAHPRRRAVRDGSHAASGHLRGLRYDSGWQRLGVAVAVAAVTRSSSDAVHLDRAPLGSAATPIAARAG